MYDKNLDYKVNIRLSTKDYFKLTILANNRKIKTSALIRYIIKEYLRNYT